MIKDLVLSFGVLLVLLTLGHLGHGCAGGNGNDFELVTNPAFTMEISPPVGWTFFPILPSGATAPTQNPWFFIGQSNDTTQAKQRATNEIEAAMLESLMESQVPLPGIVVNNDWTPIQVENPDGKTTGTGPLYGKVEGGALTQTAPGATTLIYTVYHHQLTVTVMNLKATRFTLNIVKNDFIQRLTTRYNVKFVGSVVIN